MDTILRLLFTLLAFAVAVLSPTLLTSPTENLDWTGYAIADAFILLAIALVIVFGMGGKLGGIITFIALLMTVGTALISLIEQQNFETIAFFIVVISMTGFAIKGKLWKAEGADFTEKKGKKSSSSVKTKAAAGVTAATLLKTYQMNSGNKNPPVVTYHGKGAYLGIQHLGGNTWEVSWQRQDNRNKVTTRKVNRGIRTISPYSSDKFEFKW